MAKEFDLVLRPGDFAGALLRFCVEKNKMNLCGYAGNGRGFAESGRKGKTRKKPEKSRVFS